MTFSLLVCHAQQENKYLEDRIDSLEIKLNKLQYDHNLLLCQHELDIYEANIGFLVNDLALNTIKINIYMLHNNFETDISVAFEEYYESQRTLYSARLIEFDFYRYKSSIIVNSSYSDNERGLIESKIKFIENLFNTAKKNLELMKFSLDTYKDYTKKSSKPKRNKRRPDYYD